MNSKIIPQTINYSLMIGIIGFAFLSQSQPLSVAWGWFLGTLVSTLNLYLLSRLFQTFLIPLSELPKNKKTIFYHSLLKIPIFYGSFIFLYYMLRFSIDSFMIGFSIPLIVIVLKVIGPIFIKKRAYKERNKRGISNE